MFLPTQKKLFLSFYSNCSRTILTGSKNFLLIKSSATSDMHARIVQLHSCSSCSHQSHSSYSGKSSAPFGFPKHFPSIGRKAAGYSYIPYSASAMPILRPVPGVGIETHENQLIDEKQLMILRQKLQDIGIDGNSCLPGKNNGLICPRCKGGDSGEKSLSVKITPNGGAAAWICYRAKCGWKGATPGFVDVKKKSIAKVKQPTRIITEESLGLEPLCNELLAYFAGRMISGETLRRNSVMQKRSRNEIAIAFTYRRNRELVSCKYRYHTCKRFWQEVKTERIFYGLDDIKDASDIIIVEGEMDKLAMEEVGFINCVSVPDGAPGKLSNMPLPSEEEDTSYQYLWNCKDYTEKASRIILATDGDAPGQALAEELARRFGIERCWRVVWPKKNDMETFNDANEVLMHMGRDALRDVIDTAELYPVRGAYAYGS